MQPVVQQPVVFQHPNVVYATVPQQTSSDRFNAKAAKIIGALITAGGALSVVFGIGNACMRAYTSQIGAGIWIGAGFYIATGILGIVASRNKQHGWITAYMVMCILTASVGSPILMIIQSVNSSYYDYYVSYWWSSENYERDDYIQYRAVSYILLSISLLEFILCIIGSAFCCNAVCCYSRPGVVLTTQAYGGPYVTNSRGGATTVIHTTTNFQPMTAPQYQQQGQMNPAYATAPYDPSFGQGVPYDNKSSGPAHSEAPPAYSY